MRSPYRFGLAAGAVLAAFFAGVWYRGRIPNSPATASPGRKILYWHDPMHPAYKSDKPGIAPDCGMQLEPVYADGGEPAVSRPSGAVGIDADRRQLIGVRLGEAEKLAPTRDVRLLGQVVADETQVYRIFGGAEGWIREISPHAIGMVVQKDELLATYFTRDFQTPQNAYIYALNNKDRAESNADQDAAIDNNVRLAEEGLINLGMSPTQIREIARARLASSIVQVRAPETGIILLRNVSHNLRIDRSTELYQLADIRTVYVYAEAPELDAEHIPLGADAEVRYRDRVLKAHIAKALPLFDTVSRKLKVRLEMQNPGYVLRPGMFVDVRLPVRLPPGITVPMDAVMDSGTRKLVYVAHGDDWVEPRQVETGWRFADRVQILSGLEAGERIVVSGNFLIDSEARMKGANRSAASNKRVKDPVCGMEVEQQAAAGSVEYSGLTYYFCSRECEEKFRKNQKQYAAPQRQVAQRTPAPR